MKSFQLRVTRWVAFAFFGVMFFLLVVFNIYAVHELSHAAKIRMKTISRSILKELDSAHVPDSGPIPREVTEGIVGKLAFMDHDKRLAYAIVTQDHDVLYQTAGFNIPFDDEFLAKKHKRMFLLGIGSGRLPEDLLSEWRFLYRYSGERFIVFISDSGEYELLERVLQGTLIVLILALIMAVPTGFLVSRAVLRPLKAIGGAAAKIRQGNLDTRIPPTASEDEIGQLIADLNGTFEELESSFSRMKQFSADTAHELNTPLTALRGNLEVCLSRLRSPEEYQIVLSETIEGIADMTKLVRDLLLLAVSPDESNRRQHFEDVCLSAIVADVVNQLAPIADQSNIQIDTHISQELTLRGDSSMLSRLCRNLLSNAIRFSPPDSTVTVVLRRQEKSPVLEVTDHGIGISLEEQKRIFGRFYQVDTSRQTGSGLGLAIAKWIAALHNGRITVQSTVGEGSIFRVTF